MTALVVAAAALRIAVGGILVVAAIAKLRLGYAEVQRTVADYRLLPYPVAKAWARLLPPLELVLGAALIAGVLIPAVATAAAALMACITAAVVQAIVRKRRVACGCFGAGGKLTSWPVVVRNSVLITALTGLAIGGGNL